MKWLLSTCPPPLMSPFGADEKTPPLGIGFLISALRKAGHRVNFKDCSVEPDGFPDGEYLLRNRIDFVGIYVNTLCLDELRRISRKLRDLKSTGKWNGKIVVGGPHPSILPESIPAEADYICIGEGERSILDITENDAPGLCNPASWKISTAWILHPGMIF